LFIGTRSGIYLGGAATYNDEAITPSNFRIRRLSSVGASPLQPITAMDTVFFTDTSAKNVYEIVLGESGTYQTFDLSLLASDITQSGIIAHAWQQIPFKTYWCIVNNGYLCALTYLKNNDILAWSTHVVSGKNTRVTSLTTIHEDRNDYVWIVVQREINGQTKRYIEYLHPMYDPLEQEEFKQFYVDSGITKEQKYTINRIVGYGSSSKSKNASIAYDMSPIKQSTDFDLQYLVCFKTTAPDNLLGSRKIFIARNITSTGFDLYFDTRLSNRNIPYQKINPQNYPNYPTPQNTKMFYKVSNISDCKNDRISVLFFIRVFWHRCVEEYEIRLYAAGL
jgi:hypothetical protein